MFVIDFVMLIFLPLSTVSRIWVFWDVMLSCRVCVSQNSFRMPIRHFDPWRWRCCFPSHSITSWKIESWATLCGNHRSHTNRVTGRKVH